MALQEREDRVSELQDENRYITESQARLEERLRQRDEDSIADSARLQSSEAAVEELREELSRALRDQKRIQQQHDMELKEAHDNGIVTRSQSDALVRDKAAAEVRADQLVDRTRILEVQLEKAQRQVMELQKDSSEKDLKISQLQKLRAQDKEDMQGLNIALDAKQQELELVKRKLSSKSGDAVPTPATSKAHRRVSSMSTATWAPIPSRPSTAMSDASELSDAPITVKKTTTLAKSARANALAPASSSLTTKPMRQAIAGSRGPPPSRASLAVVSTSRPSTESISARLSRARSPPSTTPQQEQGSSRRCVSSSLSSASDSERCTSPHSASGLSEKENATPRPRRPTLAVAVPS
jgi:hypothetical protein